jgi:serine protease Do
MDYKIKTCPICGSKCIEEVSEINNCGNIFHTYKCISCDGIFSSKKEFEKKQQIEQKIIEKKEEKRNTSAGLSAVAIYKNNVGCVVNLSCLVNELVCLGTGIIISDTGYVLTNAHVIMELSENKDKIVNLSETIMGSFYGGKDNYELEFVFADPQQDMAILKIIDEKVKAVVFCESLLETGDKIFTIGNSKGEGMCILEGIVSDNYRKICNNEYLMISAPVTNGNSGGPVFNVNGQVVGMVTSGHKDTLAMNYAIPINVIKKFIIDVEDKEGIKII